MDHVENDRRRQQTQWEDDEHLMNRMTEQSRVSVLALAPFNPEQ